MSYFVAIQHTYDSIELALFEDRVCHMIIREDKTRASKFFLLHLQSLLMSADLALSDLACLGVNQGPGPFTTLRTVLSCANGIGFSSRVPLIGISGMDAFLDEYMHEHSYLLAILNAFNQDLYVGIQTPEQRIIGCMSITALQQMLHHEYAGITFFCIGNGVTLHGRALKDAHGSTIDLADPLPQTCSIKQVGRMVHEKLHQGAIKTRELMPLYLKEQTFTTRTA